MVWGIDFTNTMSSFLLYRTSTTESLIGFYPSRDTAP